MNTPTAPQTATTFRTSRGRSAPLGATPLAEGVNFVLMCRHGTKVNLVIQSTDSDTPLAEIPLDCRKNRTGDLGTSTFTIFRRFSVTAGAWMDLRGAVIASIRV